jgi:hypothetical protein
MNQGMPTYGNGDEIQLGSSAESKAHSAALNRTNFFPILIKGMLPSFIQLSIVRFETVYRGAS